MNSLTRIMSYDKTKNVNQKCNCDDCKSIIKNQTVEYPLLTEEEIEQIIKERYDYKDEKTKIFIRKALRKHGDRYDYSNVIYIKSSEKVEIICRVEGHGSFWQKSTHHISRGQGCPICGIKKQANSKKSTTEKFIEKSNKVHGVGTYNYSEVKYINAITEVTIICPKHGEFKQTPHSHLKGHGCPKCKCENLADLYKLTKEEFIEQSNEIHGEGTYDYSKVEYINSLTDVIIICPKHGEFLQRPSHHLNGCGCPSCSGNKKSTTEEFIEKANEKQGIGRYNYSKVEYINAKTKVIIICSIHGEFKQTPTNHLNGDGCPICDESKGESKIRLFLTNNKIKFEIEKRFDDCRYKNPLPFDFYLPKYNLCIEFDGKGHFEKINWTGEMNDEEMEENLKLNQFRDQIKNNYCKEKGINLLRIRYDENVKEKLAEYFQSHGIIEQTISNL